MMPVPRDKRPSSAALRRLCLETNRKTDWTGRLYMRCHICKGIILPAIDKWEAEHVQRRVLSQDDSASNLKPAHVKCHREKTRADISENAKGKRIEDKHYGLKRLGWGGKWKKRMSGEVIPK